MNYWVRFVQRLSYGLNWGAMGAITVMMCLIFADVILRRLGFPILGTYEISGLLGGVAISFALPLVTRQKGHVAVELLMKRTHPLVQRSVNKITQTLSMILFGLLSWQSAKYARVLWESGEVSMTIGLPFYPVVYAIALASAVVSMVIFIDLFRGHS
jgi:TRAP-type C4-dicarboxylate transport system permease small subunit